MSRTLIDVDDEALELAAQRLGTTTKVSTVNAALRHVATQQAALDFLAYLKESDADLGDTEGAWRE